MDQRQWTAIVLILMLGNAGGARIQEEVGLRKALNSFGRAGDVTRADIVEVAEGLNNTCDDIKKGWWVVTYCMGTCPHKWAQVVHSQWSMKRMAKSLVSQQLGGSFGLPALKDVDALSYKTVVSTMVNSAWTFMQAVDNSIVQRALLSVWMLPGAAFRALFGLKPFGMCFFKSSWAEMQKLTTYRMKSTGWWDAVLAGCGEDSNVASDAFEDTSGTEKLLDGMVYSISKQNDLTGDSDEADNEEGETMARAKEVIDEQMTVIKHEREILSIAAKLERLIATAMPDDPEAAEIGKDMDMTGDSSTDELAEKVGGATFAGGDSEEDRDAEKILAQIRHSSSLLQNGGNATHGHALLAEAFDQALAHEGLSTIMEGQTKVSDAGSAVGGGGTLTVTELALILVFMSAGIVFASPYLFSTVETSSKVEALPRLLSNTNSTQPKFSPKKP